MKFSYNWLQSFFDKQLPKPNDLAELLTMHSFEVEETKSIKYQVSSIKYDDYMLDIDILPNRAHDCLSHLGMAREIAALAELKISANGGSALGGKNQKGPLTVTIKDKKICPRYSAYVIEGIKITESPDWIKERLASMDQKSINNVVDITNYVMWELGQPLHAFDFNKIKGASMDIRLSKKGEKLETLDRASHDLGDDTIVIEDDERIIDLAGIKGGANTQVDKDTSTIIFQAAIFESSRIRKSSQKLGIKTDAAVRYIHRFDYNLPPRALERTVELLRETNRNAKISQKIDIYPDLQKSKNITVDTRYTNSMLGTDISKKAMEQILQRLGFKMPSFSKGFNLKDIGLKFQVTAPSYRMDINIAEDVVEEIGRVYGYENIKAVSPQGTLISPKRNDNVSWRQKSSDILSGFGFSEVYNYSLIPNTTELELQNPVSDEFKYMRSMLSYGLFKNFASNERRFENIKIFEFGKVFGSKSGFKEHENCAFAINSGDKSGESFYEIKGYLDELFNKLGITDFYLDPALSEDESECLSFLHSSRRANIVLDNEKIGFIGEVHPSELLKSKIKSRVYVAEFDFGKMQAAVAKEHIYQKPSKYPEIVRDVAVLAPLRTRVFEIQNAINEISGPLLRDIDLFDMFSAQGGPVSGGEGGILPKGMTSFAFHLIFQSDERTLKTQEIDEIIEKIIKVLHDNLWEVR